MNDFEWVKCPKCGNAVASTSTQCPTCSTNVKDHIEQEKEGHFNNVLAAVFSFALMAGIAFSGRYLLNLIEEQFGIGADTVFRAFCWAIAFFAVSPFALSALVSLGLVRESRTLEVIGSASFALALLLVLLLILFFIGSFATYGFIQWVGG